MGANGELTDGGSRKPGKAEVDPSEVFDRHRPLLFSIAYRMLGSVMDAEDVVQEAYLRWQQASATEVRSPKAYLSSVVTRLCIDRLRSARAQREKYVGPWLPEPLPTEPAPDAVVIDETLSMAFLVLLESLNPTERAVFLLREVFDYDYDEISHLVGKSEANCRQIARRARQSVAARRPRFERSPEQEEQLVARFVEACASGDMEGLLGLLSEDVTLWSDGGGKTRAALNPIYGADKVARFLSGILRKAPSGFIVRQTQINGRPGLIGYFGDGSPQGVVTFDIAGGASGQSASWSTRRSSGPWRRCLKRKGGREMGEPEILVTGGTGTLGRRVVDRLRAAELEVRVLSRSGRPGTVRGDLSTGENLEAAIRGIDTIIHCASNPVKLRRTDVAGTELLLQEAARAGVSHVVFISIVGVDRNPYFPYYRAKLDAERVVERSPVPWTILRATQFHDLVLMALHLLDRMPVVMPIPRGFRLQPMDVGEAAIRLVELSLAGPAGRVPDVGGPEVLTSTELARAYLEASGRSKRLVGVPLPGKAARAVREGAQLCPDKRYGTVRWEEFLRENIQHQRISGPAGEGI